MKKLLHGCLILFLPFSVSFAQSCTDQQATAETKALYKNLYSLIGKNIMFGHQDDLAYGVGWGLLTHTRFGPAFFKEGHGDGAQNYMICFERRKACMILLTIATTASSLFARCSRRFSAIR